MRVQRKDVIEKHELGNYETDHIDASSWNPLLNFMYSEWPSNILTIALTCRHTPLVERPVSIAIIHISLDRVSCPLGEREKKKRGRGTKDSIR